MGQKLVKSYIFDNGPDYYVSGFSRFERNKKIGFVNLKGKIIVDAQYGWASPFFFSKPVAVVCIGCVIKKGKFCCDSTIEGGKWGVINNKGETVIPIKFTAYGVDNKGSLILKKGQDNYKIFVNRKGKFQAIKQ